MLKLDTHSVLILWKNFYIFQDRFKFDLFFLLKKKKKVTSKSLLQLGINSHLRVNEVLLKTKN